ncbi:maf protein [Psychromonas ingrahamii 37]|uniref:7-methyl-GTP pyrophosphatase n=1 Tax=Psychromonas ingrahamii (strain DSM 17664 / CCUG 51855 / 37) TaxID=357804 RepID=A1STV7_PSYIN|nr:Maf family protein [Psychromonas ingrahamii]ABM02922.1 maf protein [Psychromonas ingrahamii 37]
MSQKLILASTSPFRKELLDKLNLVFDTAKPDVDETPLPEETATALVERLAIAKAQAIAPEFTDALIIGSDQVCVNQGQILGKPGNIANAFAQLKAASGKRITFYTGLALLNTQTGTVQSLVEPYVVQFRALSDQMINHYLEKEQPFNCAGSFKSEGFGIALFESLEGKDPNSLIGLPLISLINMLEKENFPVLG